MEHLANETPTSADAARDPGPDRYEPPDEGVLLQRGLIEPVSLEVRENVFSSSLPASLPGLKAGIPTIFHLCRSNR